MYINGAHASPRGSGEAFAGSADEVEASERKRFVDDKVYRRRFEELGMPGERGRIEEEVRRIDAFKPYNYGVGRAGIKKCDEAKVAALKELEVPAHEQNSHR